jgi:hypothetical protein
VTATERLDPPAAPPTDGPSRRPLLLVAAGLVAVVIVALVLLVGVVRPPTLEPLADPAFDGTVAVASWERDWCLSIIDAGGSRTEVRCDGSGGELLGWPDEGVLVRAWEGDDEYLLTVDPRTGETLDRTRVVLDEEHEAWWLEPDVGPVSPRDGQLVVRYRNEVVWSVEADEPYEVTAGWASPDGRWLILQDSADRLLVVPTDGSAPPAVWAEDVDPWASVAWQGATPSGR